MPVANVFRLQEYRDRRSARLRLAQALQRADTRRVTVLAHLVEIAELTGADRAAAVWVDEHGTGLIHPYVVADQLHERPRRGFTPGPLRGAWQLGVPSAFDHPAEPSAHVPSTFAVALGSDGARAWFVLADSITGRPPVANDLRDRIMFLAGECAAVVLHRDLDAEVDTEGDGVGGARFAGWDILADLEGRESDEMESRRIAQRFVVARLVRMLVDEDLTVAPDRTAEQVRRARAELEDVTAAGAEAELWRRTLAALEAENFEELATALVELGRSVEEQGHHNGARELYGCAHRVAAAVGAPRPAAEAARRTARLCRRLAEWGSARRWLDVARQIADVAELDDLTAKVLVGLAEISKETGNLPAARVDYSGALSFAERSADREVIALVHHGLLGLEHAAGNLPAGLEHGWISVAMYESTEGRVRCLAALAGALEEYGDHAAAEDAWTVVASSAQDKYYQIFANDALAYLAALRGDLAEFVARAERCDALGWESGPGSAKAQILFYRGLSYRALGQLEVARSWLSRALAYAEEHKYNRVLFRAEEALRQLGAPELPATEPAPPPPAAPPEVREGLRTMRREMAGAEA